MRRVNSIILEVSKAKVKALEKVNKECYCCAKTFFHHTVFLFLISFIIYTIANTLLQARNWEFQIFITMVKPVDNSISHN